MGIGGDKDGKAVAVDGKLPVLAISPVPVMDPGTQERYQERVQAPLEVNVIETYYGTDARMGQEGNGDPSGQGKEIGVEGNQRKK